MKKLTVIFLLLFILMKTSAQHVGDQPYNYTEQWIKIESLGKEDLPKSAITEMETLMGHAVKEKNTEQIIKAFLFIQQYESVITDDNKTKIFGELEDLLNETTKISDKSVLHSMLAELYSQYYRSNTWQIDQRTTFVDYVPNDIQEWPKNLFFDKIIYHLNKSTENKKELLSEKTIIYNEIIKHGNDSKEFYPTLFDFLLKRKIEIASNIKFQPFETALRAQHVSTEQLGSDTENFIRLDLGNSNSPSGLTALIFYQEYLQSLLERNITETLVLTELNRNSYLQNQSSEYKNKFALNFLLSLEKKYSENPISVFIIEKIADLYQTNIYGSNIYMKHPENQSLAYDRLIKGIEKFPDYKYTDILRAKLAKMEEPFATINGDPVFHPENKNKKFILNYRNLNRLTVIVYEKGNEKNNPVKEIEIQLEPKDTYSIHEKEIDLDLDKPGNYVLFFDFDKEITKETKRNYNPEIYITKLMALSRAKGQNEYEFYVIERLTGKPVKNASIIIEKDSVTVATIRTDKAGFVTYKTKENLNNDYSLRSRYTYKVFSENDRPDFTYPFPYEYRFTNRAFYEDTDRTNEEINIFTDRSLYRPGQTVYFKAIVSKTRNGEYMEPVNNRKLEMELYDVNFQKISIKNLVTDDFGSVSGEFILPVGASTGMYYLKSDNESYYIGVEEYKRPTFQITFDKIDKSYTFGETVNIRGQAENFSGIKLQDAAVSYTITKRNRWPWQGTMENVDNGTVTTAPDGSFMINFTIPKNTDPNIMPWRNIFTFEINATITDINGETQSGSFTLTVGAVSMILNTDIGYNIEKDSDKNIEINAYNLNGEKISAQGSYTVQKIDINGNDTIRTNLMEGSFETGVQIELAEKIKKLESGQYNLKLSAKDSYGNDVETENMFLLYSRNDKKPPIYLNDWLLSDQNIFSQSKPAEIILGISSQNITVLYELMVNEKIYVSRQVQFNNENKKFIVPYKKEFESGVYAIFTYVIDEMFYQHVVQINKEEKDKELTLKLETFRDKLRPGSNEEWRISVKDNQNKPVLAEVLASMYDSSLDNIAPYRAWSFNSLYNPTPYPITFRNFNNARNIYITYSFEKAAQDYPLLSFDKINWFGFTFQSSSRIMIRGTAIPSPAPSTDMDYAVAESSGIDDALQGRSAGYGKLSENIVSTAGVTNNESIPVQIRQNFNETAFFYPNLRTNENGETIIGFTVPESNTIWKFRAIAHDKSMNTGTLEAFTVSRKELMVTPNLPRFMRQGDKTTVSTKISNLSENTISGNVYIEFFDPITEKTIDIPLENKSQSFSLAKDGSGSASWLFTVPADTDVIGCRIIARSELFSDGEQHAVPVLPNRMLVTETLPVYVNGNETKNYTLEKLANNRSETLSNYRLTFEYASNPAWYAVQALPIISNPTNENAVNWFASYYANTLGYAIGMQYPKVVNMINAWKSQGGTKESFISNLEKNQELKTVLLEETPWVLEAKTETEQMERLSLLFDLNNTTQKTNTAIAKLADLQNSDGSWSWMKGFYPNRSITQYILFGFAELVEMGVQHPNNVKEMQMRAIQYIDKQILADYQNLQNNNTNLDRIKTLSTNQLEYLYVRSFYRDIPIDIETRQAERFFTEVAENNRNGLDLYQRSLLAVVSYKNGNKQVAESIIKSLCERASTDKEKGMFWANNKSNVFMSLSAVSTHVFLMKAFDEIGAGEEEMDKMKQWLVNQKQTQIWESTHATMDAIYALLSTGNDWFTDNSTVNITIGNISLEAENKQAGTGYFKKVWDKTEINPEMAKIQISKDGAGPSFGALYWQYFEDLDKITRQTGAFSLDKMLFIETTSGLDKGLVRVTENNPLKIGDKVIVRLTVKTDRDMEFVHLKDMRASCFEPVEILSGNNLQNGVVYYQSTKDASTNFYFNMLPKGTYVFEYPLYVTRSGEYSNGISTIQCMYAPEFISNTEGINITIE